MRARAAAASFLADESGATAIEYGLLAALIAVAIIGSLTVFGDAVTELFSTGPGAAGNVIANQTRLIPN